MEGTTTFTEDEVKKVRDFVSFVHDKMKFKECVTLAEASAGLIQLRSINEVIKSMENNILELKAIHNPPKNTEKATPQSKRNKG